MSNLWTKEANMGRFGFCRVSVKYVIRCSCTVFENDWCFFLPSTVKLPRKSNDVYYIF